MAKKEYEPVNAIAPSNGTYRGGKERASESERARARKRPERRVQRNWAALTEDEALYPSDYENAI